MLHLILGRAGSGKTEYLYRLAETQIRAGGTVTLDVSKAEATLVFTVTDTGPGFTPEALHKAGQFLYTDAARPCNGHQGLGLCLARSVAQAHGGKLVLANTGIGAQAQLCLPMQ